MCERLTVFNSYKHVINYLKRTYRPDKEKFELVPKYQRFPFVALDKSLEDVVEQWQRNEKRKRQEEREADRKRHPTRRLSTSSESEREKGSEETETIEDRKSTVRIRNEDIHLQKINEENDVLDFDFDNLDGDENENEVKTNEKIKLTIKKEGNAYKTSQKENRNNKQEAKLNNHNNNNNKLEKKLFCDEEILKHVMPKTFKIPKKSDNDKSVTSEGLYSHVKGLLEKRQFVEAYNYLMEKNEDILEKKMWRSDEILELMTGISLGLARSMKIQSDFMKLEKLRSKLFTANYKDNDYWDNLVETLERTMSIGKNVNEVKRFLAGCHDYLLNHEIRMQQLHNESVLKAYQLFKGRL